MEWQRKTDRRIYDGSGSSSFYTRVSFNKHSGGWNIYKFVQWANDPDSSSYQSSKDAIDHPEKYPYHTASNGKQTLGYAVFWAIGTVTHKLDSNDMLPDSYTIIPKLYRH